jgi:hypothetical protein
VIDEESVASLGDVPVQGGERAAFVPVRDVAAADVDITTVVGPGTHDCRVE